MTTRQQATPGESTSVSSGEPPPGDAGRVRCPTCGAPAGPWGEPALLGGTALVALQRYRCARTLTHWWDRSSVIVQGL